MRIGAIISEFNPFHNGHKHIIECAKNDGYTHIISIMSGNYVQRGEPAIFSKSRRVEAALKNGVDLIIEMPCVWAVSRAERYARAGVWLTDSLGCVDSLIFGSECGDLSRLTRLAEVIQSRKFREILPKYLDQGFTFAKAREFAVSDLILQSDIHDFMSAPNNILGLEYIKSIKRFNSSIAAVTFTRDKALKSASEIRDLIKSKNSAYLDHVPVSARGNLECINDIFWGERSIIAVLNTLSLSDFNNLPDISVGLGNKIYASVKECCDLHNLFELIKSKRYTMSRIKRIIMSAYLGVTESVQKRLPPYTRVLGATKKGLEILKIAKYTTKLPIFSTYSELKELDDFSKEIFEIECKATDLLRVFNEGLVSAGSEKKFKFIRRESI